MFEDEEDIEFAVKLNCTYIVASLSREKETELHNQAKKDIPELIVPDVVNYLITLVVEVKVYTNGYSPSSSSPLL